MRRISQDSTNKVSNCIDSSNNEPLSYSLSRLTAALESLTVAVPCPPSPPRNVHLIHADTLGEMYSLRKYATDIVSYEVRNASDALHSQMIDLRADQVVSSQIAVDRLLAQEHVVENVQSKLENMLQQCHTSDRHLIQLMDRLKHLDSAVHHNDYLIHKSLPRSN
jgi:hypothetical protein